MEYSNEAIELLENVLSSVNESERWQYRYADMQEKKLKDINKQIKNERKKIEEYGKDRTKLNELLDKRSQLTIPDIELEDIRKGKGGDSAWNRTKLKGATKQKGKPDSVMSPFEKYGKPGDYDPGHVSIEENEPKNKALHDRINKRTVRYDTTAKHEAALILIEALNTLLNE